MTDHEQIKATATDRYIRGEHQPTPAASAPVIDPADAAVIAALQQLAATTTADPAFVARLATLIDSHEVPQPAASPAPALHSITAPWWRRLAWPVAPRRLAVALAIFLAVSTIGVLVTTPAARATVWDLLYGFGLINEQDVAEQTVPAVVPTQAEAAPAAMELAEIQQQAGFELPLPQWLPADLLLTGGFVEQTAAGAQVTLAYHLTPPPADGYALDAPLLFLVISQGPIDYRPMVAEAALTPLQVGDGLGMYAHGNWGGNTVAENAGAIDGLQWDEALDATWLTWQQTDLNFLLYTQGLAVDRATTVKIAESMAK